MTSPGSTNTSKHPFADAISHHRQGHYTDACDSYQEALKRYPCLKSTIQFNISLIRSHGKFSDLKWSYDAAIKDVPEKPRDFPDWLKIPAIKGAGNDYSFIEAERDRWMLTNTSGYYLHVSVVVPVYNRSRELEFVLAGLTHQTYPLPLIEVIIADDGSREDIEAIVRRYSHCLSIKYCRQDDAGYRLAKVRNLGIRMASHASLIILDSDAIPCPVLVETYMQYFHVRRDVAMFGLRKYVDVSCIDVKSYLADPSLIETARQVISENTVATRKNGDGHSIDWRKEILHATNYLKEDPLPYRLLVGANCAFSRELFDQVDGYCEEFCDWGYEDQEFGYRLFRQGAYFIPVRHNYVYHQEPVAGKNDTDRLLGEAKTRPLFVQKCPFIYRQREPKAGVYRVPLVSIYIPLYNRKDYILPCIDSALSQTIRDLEVVVADDGSTDGSRELVERHFGSHPRVRLLSQPNGGIAAASNLAVENALGCYVGQLDADDLLMRDAVEICLREMEKNARLSLVYGTTEYIDSDGRFVSEGWNWPMFSREHLLSNMIVHHFRFFRMQAFNRTGGFDETLKNAVDYDMMLKLSEVGEVLHLNTVMYQYRKHEATTTIQNGRDQIQNHYRCINAALVRIGHPEVIAESRDQPNSSRSVRFRVRSCPLD